MVEKWSEQKIFASYLFVFFIPYIYVYGARVSTDFSNYLNMLKAELVEKWSELWYKNGVIYHLEERLTFSTI